MLALSNLKAFAGDIFNLAITVQIFFGRVESIVGKGENAGYQGLLKDKICKKNMTKGENCQWKHWRNYSSNRVIRPTVLFYLQADKSFILDCCPIPNNPKF